MLKFSFLRLILAAVWDEVGLSGNSVRVFLGVRLSAAEIFAKPENVSPMSHQNYNGLPHAAQINENFKANFY